MPKLEVFFDYACPFCLRGHEYLTELLAQYPHIEVEWVPCEANPRPSAYGRHSDLLARGMYIAQELGVTLMEYHSAMYKAVFTDKADIEDAGVVSALAGAGDTAAFRDMLLGGAYEGKLAENNRLAWSEYGFAAVPSYRMGDSFLKCIPGIGVTAKMLKKFLDAAPR